MGSKFQYYNQNYRVLGQVIETVSGQAYADYMRANIFSPLGLAHTTARPDELGVARGAMKVGVVMRGRA